MAKAGMHKPTPVDTKQLMDIAGGDTEFLKEVVGLYFERTSVQFRELSAALDRGDSNGIEHGAHRCAGSSAQCGMVDIASIFRRLEELGRDGKLDGAKELLEAASEEFERIRRFLDYEFPHTRKRA
jgi:HPt (histidine-containing phosphotransfer) domain-containing protein